MMEIETIVHMKNGEAFIFPTLVDEVGKPMFDGIEQARIHDADVNIYGSNGTQPVKARDIRSIEFKFN